MTDNETPSADAAGRRRFLRQLAAVPTAVWLTRDAGAADPQPATGRQPNIILIYPDQQRWDTLHALGNPIIRTPNLDALCREGVAFTQATVPCPVCVPSRHSLMSGQYSTTHRSYSNHHPRGRSAPDLPGELRRAGYRTGIVGKNHTYLGEADFDAFLVKASENEPFRGQTGFPAELAAWFQAAGAPGRYPATRLQEDPDVKRRVGAFATPIERRVRVARPDPRGERIAHDPMHRHTDDALRFIAESAGTPRPFFLWLSYLYPHTPFESSDPFYSLYDAVAFPPPPVEPEGLARAGKPFRQVFHQENNDRILPFDAAATNRMRRNYYAAVSLLDFEIGRVIALLDKLGVRDDTIIIFTSDHGDYQADHGLFTKSPSLYESLVRVPLVCSWPGRWKQGVVSDELVSEVDLMPTLLTAAGAKVPATVQGKPLNALLRDGRIAEPIRAAAFAEYGIPGRPFDRARLERAIPDYRERPIDVRGNGVPWEGNPVSLAGRFRMIRTREWKLVHERGGTSELYDLRADPHELVNLFDRPEVAKIQADMLEQLQRWVAELPGSELDGTDVDEVNLQEYLKWRANPTTQRRPTLETER